jgi:hypothetical protein
MLETGVNLLALGILGAITIGLWALASLLVRFAWQEWIEWIEFRNWKGRRS